MRVRRILAACVVAVAVASGAVRPEPARADAKEAAIIAGAALGGVLLFVIVGTAITRSHPALLSEAPQGWDPLRDPDARVRWGLECGRAAASPMAVCW